MTTFLLIVSFAFHIIAFFLIILLYLKLTKVKEVEARQSTMMREMEEAITSYLMEFKEENERFLQKLSEKMRETETKKAIRQQLSANIQIEEKKVPLDLPNLEEIKDKIEISQSVKKGETREKKERDEVVPFRKKIPTMVEEAFRLQQEGKTVEEIARILKKGKTEIELLLKFRQM